VPARVPEVPRRVCVAAEGATQTVTGSVANAADRCCTAKAIHTQAHRPIIGGVIGHCGDCEHWASRIHAASSKVFHPLTLQFCPKRYQDTPPSVRPSMQANSRRHAQSPGPAQPPRSLPAYSYSQICLLLTTTTTMHRHHQHLKF
jgi:hypothetical protein